MIYTRILCVNQLFTSISKYGSRMKDTNLIESENV